ncbi:Transmembrane protease serine 9 [Folsomia candida]|uniref:Transmembrane protease serine 9 n=1 Tax=Folsomia candida TaxID=158441 RepID=A0A226D162_FOLCA|nr:Transmembrane protease serine 9 [Folsomia candida]
MFWLIFLPVVHGGLLGGQQSGLLKGKILNPGILPLHLLGLDAFANDTVRLKRILKDSHTISEMDCAITLFMSPFHSTTRFTANESIGLRQDPTCVWNFVGTEPCLPTITCTTFTVPCESTSLHITDGVHGEETYCGDKVPKDVTASMDLRDLYVTLKGNREVRLDCSVTCGKRGSKQANPLSSDSLNLKISPDCRCGVKPNEDRLLGAGVAIPHEFPWLVALVEADTRQPFCGGSIINDRIILTAGHCFKGKNSNLLARTNDFDVAAILLATPINFTSISPPVSPICLPELPLSYMRTFTHHKATVAGWGLPAIDAPGTPEELQKLQINVFTPSECKELYGVRGDSGSPLVIEEKDRSWYQIAAVSWGDSCGQAANPGVYFRTTGNHAHP